MWQFVQVMALMGFGRRQIVRVDRRAVRIGERRDRRRLLGKLALIVVAPRHTSLDTSVCFRRVG